MHTILSKHRLPLQYAIGLVTGSILLEPEGKSRQTAGQYLYFYVHKVECKALIFSGGHSWPGPTRPGPQPSAKHEIQGRV